MRTVINVFTVISLLTVFRFYCYVLESIEEVFGKKERKKHETTNNY
jgi:hypothetical protein